MEIFIYLIGFCVASYAIYSSIVKKTYRMSEIKVDGQNDYQFSARETLNDRREWYINRFMKNEKNLIHAQNNFKKEMILKSENDFIERIKKIQQDNRLIN